MASLIRHLLFGAGKQTTTRETWVEVDPTVTEKIVGYFGRTTDKTQIRNAIINRYGTGVRVSKDPDTGTTLETYTRQGWVEQVDAGHIETVSVGWGHNVTAALATLFNQETQKFSILGEDEEQDFSDISQYFDDLHDRSQYLDAIVRADRKAVQIGTSLIFMEYFEDKFKYTVVDPGKVKVRYDGVLQSNGVTRPVNFLDIEDATCVVIETGSIDTTTKSFLAIFGRSERYPLGRYVQYESSADGKDIPDPNTDNTYDWVTESGELANPLSKYAEENPELDVPEYPIAILYGGHVEQNTLMPVSLSMLEESIEADVAASHLRSTVGDAARGTLVIERDQHGMSAQLPRSLHGSVALAVGQKIQHISHDAGASLTGWELLKDQMVSAAQAYGVPDYMVSSEDHTLEASSGVALAIRTTALQDARKSRAKLNAPAVDKIFEIERAFLLNFAELSGTERSQLMACRQLWDPGEIALPQNEKDQAETVINLLNEGIYDDIEAIKVMYNLPSESDAIDMYEKLARRREQYPPLGKEDGPESVPNGPNIDQNETLDTGDL